MHTTVLKWGLLTIFLAGLAFLFFQYARQSPETPTVQLDSNLNNTGLPTRIKIPSINVDATIEQVTKASDGSMDVPKLPLNTAWYKLGPRPGEKGSAVIDGHVNWKNSASAVFSNLYKLKPGDKVIIQDDRGALISFVVRISQTYDSSANASNIFTSNDGKAHLNLITCKGIWNQATKDYSQRLVIFTDKE